MSKKLYLDDLAAAIVKGGCKKYRPSNGTEGMMFMEMYCDQCASGEDCDILCASMCYDEKEDAYPKEWTYTAEGQPTCTAFKEAKNEN